MPSTLVGAQSGGVFLVSGNPYSGRPGFLRGIVLKSSIASSGNVYVSCSGGVTITSGGALASGGMMDGMELVPGQFYPGGFYLPGTEGPAGIALTCAATVSGFVRVFWTPNVP